MKVKAGKMSGSGAGKAKSGGMAAGRGKAGMKPKGMMPMKPAKKGMKSGVIY
jgi:hypothetical protein